MVDKPLTWVYPNNSWMPSALAPAGKSIALLLTKTLSTNKFHADQYSAFLGSLDQWGSPATVAYFKASLPLNHPLNPDAAPSLRYLRSRSVKTSEKSGPHSRRHMVSLCLNTAQVLLSNGCQTDASWVMHFLQESFAQEIGYGQLPQTTDVFGKSKVAVNETAETTNLRLLEQLAVQ